MMFRFLELVLFDDYVVLTTGLNFTNLAWMVRIMTLMHLTGLNAESEPLVLDVEEVQLFEKVTCLCKYLLIHTCIVELFK